LVVGFVGLAAERKGLPVIAAAVQLARSRGRDVRLNVIGNCPAEIAARPEVTYFGRIDKRTDIERFIEIVSALDLGCMLSRAELAGIALLEFLRLGVPVIASDVGGIPDIVALGAGELVRPDITAEELAAIFTRLIEDRDRLQRLQRLAWEKRHRASWKRVIDDLQYAVV
jgi:glycosyltransferase involved in cell wall biosynthesis